MIEAVATNNPVSIEDAREAKQVVADMLEGKSFVTGIGIATGPDGYCVKVNVNERPKDGLEIPTKVGRVGLRVEFVGAVRKR